MNFILYFFFIKYYFCVWTIYVDTNYVSIYLSYRDESVHEKRTVQRHHIYTYIVHMYFAMVLHWILSERNISMERFFFFFCILYSERISAQLVNWILSFYMEYFCCGLQIAGEIRAKDHPLDLFISTVYTYYKLQKYVEYEIVSKIFRINVNNLRYVRELKNNVIIM